MSDLKTESQDLQQEENALIALRKEKLAAERAKGNAFPNDFRRDSYCNDLQKQYADKTKEELEAAAIPVKVAGRIMLNRGSFMVIQDMTGRIQVYVNRKTLSEEPWPRSRPGTWATSSPPKAPWPVPARATCTSK
jgi:lysyl-tRNA synthetase class 2